MKKTCSKCGEVKEVELRSRKGINQGKQVVR